MPASLPEVASSHLAAASGITIEQRCDDVAVLGSGSAAAPAQRRRLAAAQDSSVHAGLHTARGLLAQLPGYDGSIWPHHDGFKWLHSVDNWTVRSGPVKSGSEKEEQIRGGARSRRHWRPADRGGADSSRPSGAGASRRSQLPADRRETRHRRVHGVLPRRAAEGRRVAAPGARAAAHDHLARPPLGCGGGRRRRGPAHRADRSKCSS